MGKLAKIVSISFPDRGSITQVQLMELIMKRVYETRELNPDLICLPEEALLLCTDSGNPDKLSNNSKLLEQLQEAAKALHCNILCSLEEAAEYYPGKSYNTSFAINREGKMIGKYRKRHITYRAFASNGLPGENLVVCDLDIGRVGMMTCFDIGWRDDWRVLKEMGAELIYWPSAYDGGFLLNAYAAVHSYYVVSSAWNKRSRIIDPLGNTLAESSGWDGMAVATVHLGTEIFHFDKQTDAVGRIRAALGDKVLLTVQDNDNMFTVASLSPEWPMERIKEVFGLKSYTDYHNECTVDNENALKKYPER